MRSQRLAPLFFALLAPCSVRTQEPDPSPITRDALQKVLNGRIEDMGEDGTLALRYPLDQAEELQDFDLENASSETARIDGQRLVLNKPEMGDPVVISLGQIHWKGPFVLRFTVHPKWPDSGLILVAMDSGDKGTQAMFYVNATAPESGERLHAALMMVKGNRFTQADWRKGARSFLPDRNHEVMLRVQEGQAEFQIDGKVVADSMPFRAASFQLMLLPSGSRIEIDELRFYGHPVPSSLRKLVRGREAKDTDAARVLEQGQSALMVFARARMQETLSSSVRRARASVPASLKPMVVAARRYEGALDFQGAALEWTRASVLAPDSAVLLWRAGRAWQLAGQHSRSRAILKAAVALDPELGEAWRDLGAVHSALEEEDLAAVAFDRAIEWAPEDTLAPLHRGVHLFGMARLDEACAQFRSILETRPDDHAASKLLADIERLRAETPWASPHKSETAHYSVATNVSAEFAERIGVRLEAYREFLGRLVPLPESQRDVRSRVWIFDSRGEYNIFAGTLMSRQAERTGGVFHPGIRTLLLFDEVDRESTLDTLFHEGFHQYIDLVNRRVPIWFNEGMAEVFGATRHRPDGTARIDVQSSRLIELQSVLRNEPERLVNLDDFMRMPKVDFYDSESISLNYALSWALCFYGMTDGGMSAEAASTGQPTFKSVFAAYARAIFDGAHGDDAYARSFGKSGQAAESFRAEFLSFVLSL